MNTEVLVEQRGATLVVTINRPQRRNAVTRQVSEGIAAAMDRLDQDEQLSVGIITGAGGSFCAGMDLQAFLDGERPEIEGRGFGGITEKPPRKPLIAAVEGFALAGGCELALACDLIVAAEDAFFGLPEVSRGLVAGSGGLLFCWISAAAIESPNWPQAELWSRQAPLVDAVLASEDAREGALAFAEKRAPVWLGR